MGLNMVKSTMKLNSSFSCATVFKSIKSGITTEQLYNMITMQFSLFSMYSHNVKYHIFLRKLFQLTPLNKVLVGS
jgi:hypothetical protein